MNNLQSFCTNPSTNYDIQNVKECLDNGYKLGTMQFKSMLDGETIPDEWEIIDINDNIVIIFRNSFIANMFRGICDHYQLGYDLNSNGNVSVLGDIIHGLFFGYCIFDIAQYCFLFENVNLNLTLNSAKKHLHRGTLTETLLTTLITGGAFKKRTNKLSTVFKYINRICNYLYDMIKSNPEYFDMNSCAVRNIKLGTLIHGCV